MKKLIARERLECRDGFSVSVQASSYHYCIPRDDKGPYTHVEVGLPSEDCPTLKPYRDSADVYAYVPVGVVWEILLAHGGVEGMEPTEPRVIGFQKD